MRRKQKLTTVALTRSHSEFLDNKRLKDDQRKSKQEMNFQKEKQKLESLKMKIIEKERSGDERVAKTYRMPKTVYNGFKGKSII